MINKLLKKFSKLSMKTGRFFADKSYKFDTIYFVTKLLYDYIGNENVIDLSEGKMEEIVASIVDIFTLPPEQADSNKNYVLETLGFLCYTNALEKVNTYKYNVIDLEQIDFITVSIENSYIFQYLVAYKTFKNDGLWNLYVDYLSPNPVSVRERKLQALKNQIASISASIGKPDSVWASNMTKFPIMVLGLANNDNKVSRELNIKREMITPENLSANVEGTKSVSTKKNGYLREFRIGYVISFLEPVLAKYDLVDYDNVPRVSGGENIILYGVPGAGKSWTIKNEYCNDEDRMERLVFHPDYTYSDFVGQILPRLDDEGSVSYEFTPGPFTKLLKRAYTNPDKMYYLIIEEVNRGNAPAIFGDIFQLLDRNKDGKSEYEITNSDIAKVVCDDENHKVYLPSNMSILCTMNTSDQNVFTLDTAFQRRWSMRLIKNKFVGEQEQTFAMTKILDTNVTWNKFFSEINKIILSKNIRMTSSEDKRLGTHFVSIDDLVYAQGDEKQNRKFPEKVLKYLWDDAFKFTKEDIFDLDNVRSLEDVIEHFVNAQSDDRFKVFKENIYTTLVRN